MKRILVGGIGLALVGVLIIVFALYLEPSPSLAPTSHESSVVVKFLDHVGIAFLSLGILGIILDLPNWQKYFQERLAEVVTQRNYLRSLGKDELVGLQTATLKAFFEVEDIDREGSLLNYFHSRVQRVIAEPFRESLSFVVKYAKSQDANKLVVDESVSYTCRRVGGRIQKQISWMPEPEEYEVQSVAIKLEVPASHASAIEAASQNEKPVKRDDGSLVFEIENKALEKYKKDEGYVFPLDKFKDCDGMRITVTSTYLISKDRFTTWTMSHPTKGCNFSASYPDELTIIHEALGNIADLDLEIVNRPGLFSVHCNTWMLPNSGFVFQLRPKSSQVPTKGIPVVPGVAA
jgi:hypothetical protein